MRFECQIIFWRTVPLRELLWGKGIHIFYTIWQGDSRSGRRDAGVRTLVRLASQALPARLEPQASMEKMPQTAFDCSSMEKEPTNKVKMVR